MTYMMMTGIMMIAASVTTGKEVAPGEFPCIGKILQNMPVDMK